MPLPYIHDIASWNIPTVVGEVAGWGDVAKTRQGWCTTWAYPLRLALVCSHCLVREETPRPVIHVHFGPNLRGSSGIALCAAHSLERTFDSRYSRREPLLPAQEVEAQLLDYYGALRADLPAPEEDPRLDMQGVG